MIRKICFALLIMLLFPLFPNAMSDPVQVNAKIIDMQRIEQNGVKGQLITVHVLEGVYANEKIDILYAPLYSTKALDLRLGHKVFISINMNENQQLSAVILNIDRRDSLLQLGFLFFIVILLFGRGKGIASLISLAISGFIIIKVLVPLIIAGYNPIFISILCTAFIVFISFILISGFTKKSVAAILGTIGGTIAAGLLAHYYTAILAITGIASEEAIYLMTELGLSIDFRGLFMSGVLIGTIGAVMDVSMSITSFVFELKHQSPRIGFVKLLLSGLKVGKDVMSTMINTLILAYAGASMPLFLVFFNTQINSSYILNTEIISSEIIRSFCGSIGLVLTVPLNAFIASSMASGKTTTTLNLTKNL